MPHNGNMMNNKQQKERVNTELRTLGFTYHNGLPIEEINNILTANGYPQLEEGIYCGREGRMHEQLNKWAWFAMTWYKMEVTGNFEVVAYVS